MPRFVRRPAVWFGLLGAAFFVVVYVSGIWEEETPAALLFFMPAYLAIALLTAANDRSIWLVAAIIATLVALAETAFALFFALGTPPQERVPEVAAIHAMGAVIAAAAAVSDFRLSRQAARRLKTA